MVKAKVKKQASISDIAGMTGAELLKLYVDSQERGVVCRSYPDDNGVGTILRITTPWIRENTVELYLLTDGWEEYFYDQVEEYLSDPDAQADYVTDVIGDRLSKYRIENK